LVGTGEQEPSRIEDCETIFTMSHSETDLNGLRFEWDGQEVLLAGPPGALRRLSSRLRASPVAEVALSDDGMILRQFVTSGGLRVAVDGVALVLTGGPAALDLVWSALDGLADEAETADPQGVQRHVHIEYLGPGDEKYRSPDSMPLVISSDWPADKS
jgi:hypothetical protein